MAKCIHPDGCKRDGAPGKDLCRIHLMMEAKRKKANAAVPRNAAAIDDLEALIVDLDPALLKRFTVDLTLLRMLAKDIDGEVAKATDVNTYRQVLEKVNARIDRLYGTKEMDMVAKIQILVDTNAKKRAAKGWG